jgi:hypothetical protein
MYKITILPVVLYGCETAYLTVREKHRMRMFENRMLRKIFGTKGEKRLEAGEDCIMRSFMTCKLH